MDSSLQRMTETTTVDRTPDTAPDTAPDTTPDPMTVDTQIAEPSMTAGEVEMLLFALERSRAQLAWKSGGLDAAGLSQALAPSTMTLGGLLKHLALVEYKYAPAWADAPQPVWRPWETVDFETDPDWDWRTAADDSPEEIYGIWHDAVAWCRAAWAAALADGGLDTPSHFSTDDGRSPNLRRLLVDLHDEYARHVGHADLLREAVDGLVGEDPPQR
jgi:hypothetical protein